jgi:phage shock protein PspC (stress-responsive transcriptional regulator)
MPKKLLRSKDDRVIAGVAGGVGQYFDLDPTLVRVAWVVAVVFGGFGLLAYIILWIVLPEGEQESTAAQVAEERYARGEISAEELSRIKEDLRRE